MTDNVNDNNTPRVVGRADTDEKKAAMLEMILAAWKRVPAQRLGQLLINACEDRLYYVEDDALVRAIEDVIERMPKLP